MPAKDTDHRSRPLSACSALEPALTILWRAFIIFGAPGGSACLHFTDELVGTHEAKPLDPGHAGRESRGLELNLAACKTRWFH